MAMHYNDSELSSAQENQSLNQTTGSASSNDGMGMGKEQKQEQEVVGR